MQSAIRKDNHQPKTNYPWLDFYPKSIAWDAFITPEPVFDILEHSAKVFADRTAISFSSVTMSYAELNTLSAKIACGLQKQGLQKGDKVGLFLPNTPYLVACYYGILKAGGVVVNYNPLYVERELCHQIEDSETDFFVTLDDTSLFEKADNVLKDSRLKALIICPSNPQQPQNCPAGDDYIPYARLIDNDGAYDSVTIDPVEDTAVLQYTGGTTGVPKGAMLTHANLYTNAQQIAQWHKPLVSAGEDKIVGVLPLFHVFAMTVVMNMSLSLGLEILLVPKFDPESFMDLLDEKKPSFIPAVPAIYNAIASHPRAKNMDLSSVKFCLSGGAPLPGGVKKAFENTTGGRLGEGYGLTEASPVLTCNPVEGPVKLGSIGLPIPGTVIEIISMEDGETILPVGERGEVCARGAQIMKGYYNKPEETANTIKNGRLHTGDVGYMDSEGYVHLVDRIKDLILVRGYNVYPTQVEEAIYQHDKVEECIVAGVPDAERGETVWAWIKPLNGESLNEEDIGAFLKDKLSPIEIPRQYVITDQPLPKTAVGKLSRKLLLEQENIQKA